MKQKITYLYLVILLLAAVLRFAYVTAHDSYTDEAILAFRAIGLIDYDGSLVQTTPWQWLPAVPWWAHLSLHDHPIFFFLLQHVPIKIFGENLFAVRLPAALAGIGSVALLFFIGRKLFDERVGLLAAALLAVSSYHLWVSRLGIQDGVVIFFLLLALSYVLKAKENSRYWIAVGAVIGLGIITKYTTLIILPIIAVYCIVHRLPVHRMRAFWYGALAMTVVSSPSWAYNIMLYRTFGHFDFQLSGFLGQHVEQWQFRMGRAQIGGMADRFKNFFLAMAAANSIWFNAAAVGSLVAAGTMWWKAKNHTLFFLLASALLVYAWFFILGSTYRFVVMIIPFLILFIASAIKRLPRWAVGMFLVLEAAFSLNSFFLPQPWGMEGIAYAKIREEEQNYGFNELDAYISQLLDGRVSALFGQPAYQFLTDMQNKNITQLKTQGATAYPVLFIYDKDINFVANLWLFQRPLIYRGWPFISDAEFLQLAGDQRDQFYHEQGIEDFVYIVAAREEVRRNIFERQHVADTLEKESRDRGLRPTIIHDRAGVEAFRVYQF